MAEWREGMAGSRRGTRESAGSGLKARGLGRGADRVARQ